MLLYYSDTRSLRKTKEKNTYKCWKKKYYGRFLDPIKDNVIGDEEKTES